MKTVEPFVKDFLTQNGYLGKPSKVIAAENYPNLATYFYRSLQKNPTQPKGGKQFFDNVMSALGIPIGNTEFETLINFLDAGYRLIDCFDQSKEMFDEKEIIEDLNLLNAQKVLFVTDNNINTIRAIASYEAQNNIINGISSKIVPDYYRDKGKIVHSFPNNQYPSQVANFKASVQLAIKLGQF